MGPIGFQELLVILVIILILFGAKKLPELARGLGKSIYEFKNAQNEVKEEFNKAMKGDEKREADLEDKIKTMSPEEKEKLKSMLNKS